MQRGIDSGGTEENEEYYSDDYEDEETFSPDSAGILSRGLGGVIHEDNLISGDMVVALYDYEAQDEDEFDIKVGDIMTIAGMDEDDEGWYLAEMDGRQGFIPWNFVQKVQAEPTPALDEVVLPADLHSELWGFESQRKNVQLTILSAQGLDARHDGCPYVQVDVFGQHNSSFRTHAVQADGRAWQQPCNSLSLQPGTSLRLSVYREVPSQPDKFLGSAELVLLDPETAWHGELCLVDEMGVMQGGLLSVAMVPGLPIDETFHPRAPIRQSLIDRQSVTPENGRRTPSSNPERNTPQSRSLMPERAQTLSPSLSKIKRKACQIIEEATRDGRLKEALRQIPKSASSVQKEQSSMARASEVKPQACAELLAAAQNGDLEKKLVQQDSMARAGDIKRQASAMLLRAAQDGDLQKALTQIPKKT